MALLAFGDRKESIALNTREHRKIYEQDGCKKERKTVCCYGGVKMLAFINYFHVI